MHSAALRRPLAVLPRRAPASFAPCSSYLASAAAELVCLLWCLQEPHAGSAPICPAALCTLLLDSGPCHVALQCSCLLCLVAVFRRFAFLRFTFCVLLLLEVRFGGSFWTQSVSSAFCCVSPSLDCVSVNRSQVRFAAFPPVRCAFQVSHGECSEERFAAFLAVPMAFWAVPGRCPHCRAPCSSFAALA